MNKIPGVGYNSLMANVFVLNPETLNFIELDEIAREGALQQEVPSTELDNSARANLVSPSKERLISFPFFFTSTFGVDSNLGRDRPARFLFQSN